MLAQLVTALFWLAVLAAALGLLRRARLWRMGRACTVQWSGLLQIPKRYLVDLHAVVAREPGIARAHAAVAGSAVLAWGLVAVNYGLMLYARALDIALLLASLLMFSGACAMAWRRRSPAALLSRLSRGGWQRLPWSLLLCALALALTGAVAATGTGAALAPWLAALIALAFAAGAAEFALGIGLGGPMKHAVAGLLHLGLHPRPERFDGRCATALRPLQLEGGRTEDMGVAKPADFAWNRLLSFDACVQCGKCEAACPAFAAGQPLNPKKLIDRRHRQQHPHRPAGDLWPGALRAGVRRRGRPHRPSQRQRLRPRSRRLDGQLQTRLARRPRAGGGHRLDQQLQAVVHRHAIRGLQGKRYRT